MYWNIDTYVYGSIYIYRRIYIRVSLYVFCLLQRRLYVVLIKSKINKFKDKNMTIQFKNPFLIRDITPLTSGSLSSWRRANPRLQQRRRCGAGPEGVPVLRLQRSSFSVSERRMGGTSKWGPRRRRRASFPIAKVGSSASMRRTTLSRAILVSVGSRLTTCAVPWVSTEALLLQVLLALLFLRRVMSYNTPKEPQKSLKKILLLPPVRMMPLCVRNARVDSVESSWLSASGTLASVSFGRAFERVDWCGETERSGRGETRDWRAVVGMMKEKWRRTFWARLLPKPYVNDLYISILKTMSYNP